MAPHFCGEVGEVLACEGGVDLQFEFAEGEPAFTFNLEIAKPPGS